MQVMWSINPEWQGNEQIIGEVVAADGRSIPVDDPDQWVHVATAFGWVHVGDGEEAVVSARIWLQANDGVVIDDPGFFG